MSTKNELDKASLVSAVALSLVIAANAMAQSARVDEATKVTSTASDQGGCSSDFFRVRNQTVCNELSATKSKSESATTSSGSQLLQQGVPTTSPDYGKQPVAKK
jgi:hypothetical protein